MGTPQLQPLALVVLPRHTAVSESRLNKTSETKEAQGCDT